MALVWHFTIGFSTAKVRILWALEIEYPLFNMDYYLVMQDLIKFFGH
jgi:hypothetical protein